MSKGILEEAQGYLQDAYRKLEIRETISRYRQRFDSEVINHKYMKQLRELPEKPKEIKASIEKELVCISTQLNDRFPYATTVCRSHPELIVASLVGFVAIPLWSRHVSRKLFYGSILATGLVGEGGVSVVNFKWTHNAPQPPKDI